MASLFVRLLQRQSGRAVRYPQAFQTQEKEDRDRSTAARHRSRSCQGKNCCSLVYVPVTRGATTAGASRSTASARSDCSHCFNLISTSPHYRLQGRSTVARAFNSRQRSD